MPCTNTALAPATMAAIAALAVSFVGCGARMPERSTYAAPAVPAADHASRVIDPLRRLAEPPSGAYVTTGDKTDYSVPVHCILADDGVVSCVWGRLPAQPIPGVGLATQIVAGHEFVCALERQGTLACFHTSTNTTRAESVTLPFRVRRIASNELGVVLEAEDGRVHHCALPYEGSLATCTLTPLDVPDADAYVNAGLRHCSLDRQRAPACAGVASDNDDDGDQPIAVPEFPKQVRRLVEGLGSYETGAVICAIGAAGELVCFRSLLQTDARPGFVAKGERIALPGPVRDLAMGASLGRVVLEDGRVYAIPMSLTRSYPPGGALFVARQVPVPEPADSISETCVRYRSGRVACSP